MVDAKIIEEKPITMAELKKEIESIRKRDEKAGSEPNFRVTQLEDYLNSFSHRMCKKPEELKKKIEELEIPRLKDAQICKIIDIMPENMEELKAVLDAYPITIVEKNLKRILELVQEHRA
ncbi:MAG: hypothetical protein QXW00_01595 [Candidatus Woesearchaeota archaeon]